jgi:hypothetical protein
MNGGSSVAVYRGGPVEIDFDYVLHRLRIDDVQSSRNARYVAALQSGIPVVTDKAEPFIFHERFDHFWEGQGNLRAGASLLAVGDLVWEQLREARSVSVGIATIGPGVEEEMRQTKERHGILPAFALESLGAIALDMVLEEFFTDYEARLKKNDLFLGVPMAPGETTGWDTRDQCSIYSLLQGELEGVTITESCLLIPRNSLSFLVGMYDHPVKKEGDTHCNYCSMRDTCLYRGR